MIAIVSSNIRERSAFTSLCEGHGWPAAECSSLLHLKRLLLRTRPVVVLTRHKLSDGYSDEVLALLKKPGQPELTRIIVLIGAGTPAALEARQISLGADAVQRDPIRSEVVSAYLSRFRSARPSQSTQREGAPPTERFAGATVHFIERTLQYGGKLVKLTPRETELIQILHESTDTVVTYDTLYSEILDRRFRGDTSNMRVLLGKLAKSLRAVGREFRPHLEVLPKMGYRYRASVPA